MKKITFAKEKRKKRNKKNIAAVLALSLLFTTAAVVSADDSVCGHIYSTDILAYVNGEPIASYNIGGKTVVIAEELGNGYYGFSYTYDDDARLLSITSSFSMPYQDHEPIPRGQTGQILGDVYQTDIQVTYNGIAVTGYNIGGKTAICIEELGDTAESPNEAFGYSKYLASYTWNPEEKTISLSSYFDNSDEIMGLNLSRVAYTFSDNVLYAQPDDDVSRSQVFPSVNGVRQETNDGACTYYYTEAFGDKKYVLSPLYLEANGSRTEIGTCVAVRNENTATDITYMHITDPAATLALVSKVKNPKKTYEEAMAYLTETYTVVEEIENENYTLLHVKNKADFDLVYAVKKTGGYAKLAEYAPGKTIGILFSDENEDEAIVTVYPFAGPHGDITVLNESHRLDLWYNFD